MNRHDLPRVTAALMELEDEGALDWATEAEREEALDEAVFAVAHAFGLLPRPRLMPADSKECYEAVAKRFYAATAEMTTAIPKRVAAIVAGYYPTATALRCIGYINEQSALALRTMAVLNGESVIATLGEDELADELADMVDPMLDLLAHLSGDAYEYVVIDLSVPSGEVEWLPKGSAAAQAIIAAHGGW